MAGTFGKRTRILGQRVGDGDLEGAVSYGPEKIAVPQHELGWRSGPLAGVTIKHHTTPGTGGKYLEGPLMAEHPAMLQQIADSTLEEGPQSGMIDSAEDLATASGRRIPKETGQLARSGNAKVHDNGALIYQREG